MAVASTTDCKNMAVSVSKLDRMTKLDSTLLLKFCFLNKYLLDADRKIFVKYLNKIYK